MLKNLALILVSVTLTLLLADMTLGLLAGEGWVGRRPGAEGPSDRRSRLEAIADLRNQSTNWFPTVPPKTFFNQHLLVNGTPTLPIAGVANAQVLGCNELGFYNHFDSDRYGFNNPDSAWDARLVDLVLVGDSFIQGDCVKQPDTIAGRMRASGITVVNLGGGGNGPLIELAALRELLPQIRARHVLWVFYAGNDLQNLGRELSDTILVRYLQPDFTQDLAGRSAALDAVLRSYVLERFSERLAGQPTVLPNIRRLVWKLRHQTRSEDPVDGGTAESSDVLVDRVEQLRRILRLAQQEAAQAGGQLIFVYLPNSDELPIDGGSKERASWALERRIAVLTAVGSLGIPIIDVTKDLAAAEDPAVWYPFANSNWHFAPNGYHRVAATILEQLAALQTSQAAAPTRHRDRSADAQR